jgi:hypothetical protein
MFFSILGGTHKCEIARFQNPKTKSAVRILKHEDGSLSAQVFTRTQNWTTLTAHDAENLQLMHGVKMRQFFARFPELFSDCQATK